MRRTSVKTCIMMVLIPLLGCSKPAPAPDQGASAPTKARAAFVNRVWRVTESSSVAPGHMYVFLSEGTLVVASPNSKPSLGTWSDDGGTLTMVEESLSYKVEILGLSDSAFKIRIHGPGEPVVIQLAPATKPLRPPGS